MALYKHKRQRRKPMAEINVVPYIDVMLVLLIIFMITAPMLTQGVQVDLPSAAANPVNPPEDNSEPLVVSVDAEGLFYAAVGENPDEPMEAQRLVNIVRAVLTRSPNTPVMVKGDSAANYGQVVYVMTLLQQAGAPSVGLITKQPEKAVN
ncbi:MAG: protein TolR [Piscirickettsiaceae bacterium]|nr:protein TolR [Piscirickettsiaceae bacterium]